MGAMRALIQRGMSAQFIFCESVITQHSYEFEWENIKILDIERQLNKKLIFAEYLIAN